MKRENLFVPEDFSLELFVRVYIGRALRRAQKKPIHYKFDNVLRKEVSRRLGITQRTVTYLSLPVIQILFSGNGNSPLEHYDNRKTSRIILNTATSQKNIEKLTQDVLKNYRHWLEDLTERIRQNPPTQQKSLASRV